MKTLKYNIRLVVALIVFSLPWVSSQAVENFQKAGVISAIGYDQFTLDGKKYRYAPGAKINSNDPKRQKFSDLKRGDQIYFEGVILNRVFYVNIIYYETPLPS